MTREEKLAMVAEAMGALDRVPRSATEVPSMIEWYLYRALHHLCVVVEQLARESRE